MPNSALWESAICLLEDFTYHLFVIFWTRNTPPPQPLIKSGSHDSDDTAEKSFQSDNKHQ